MLPPILIRCNDPGRLHLDHIRQHRRFELPVHKRGDNRLPDELLHILHELRHFDPQRLLSHLPYDELRGGDRFDVLDRDRCRDGDGLGDRNDYNAVLDSSSFDELLCRHVDLLSGRSLFHKLGSSGFIFVLRGLLFLNLF
jgi:hypothetical protein